MADFIKYKKRATLIKVWLNKTNRTVKFSEEQSPLSLLSIIVLRIIIVYAWGYIFKECNNIAIPFPPPT